MSTNSTMAPSFYPASFNSGDTAWMLTGTFLVLFMTMPGLAIFYAGMVSSKNVLAVCMQSFSVCSLITVLWLAFGYSLSFTPNNSFVPQYIDSNPGRYSVCGSGQRLWLMAGNLRTSSHLLLTTICLLSWAGVCCGWVG